MGYTPPKEHAEIFSECWCQDEGYVETDFHPIVRERGLSRVSRQSGKISTVGKSMQVDEEAGSVYRP